jgi:hypothetical protein
VKRYKIERLKVSGPIYGFLIHTPSGKTMRDTYPNTITKELNRLNNRINQLEEAGDALCENSNPSRWDSPADTARKMIDQSNWNKAKDAK